jgi:site-specific DNA-cytosine methylase
MTEIDCTNHKSLGLNVLSLFDGVSCGRIALDQLGITVNKYFASEIETSAIKCAMKNYPDTIQIGDVNNVKGADLPRIDLIIGGSPCQNFSKSVIQNINHNQGLEGVKSKLFYQYLRLIQECKPKYFFLENVAGMKDKDRNIISECMGVEYININSNELSAQDRDRLYWTNIPFDADYVKCTDVLKDILVDADDVPEKYWYKCGFDYNGSDKKIEATLHVNGHDILKRVNNQNFKGACLTRVSGGHQQKKVFQNGRPRKLMPIEYERLQCVPDSYTEGVSDTDRYSAMGNGWTVSVIKQFFKGLNNGN